LKQVVVTKRGVSPRIVEAKLIGTGGATMVHGEQLETALGGYSTWMEFRKVVNGKAAPGGGGKGEGTSGPVGGVGG
jgi:peptidoglycan hydrolase-like amidase